MKKYCPHCKVKLPVEMFYKRSDTIDGLSTYCIKHMIERVQKNNAKKRERYDMLEMFFNAHS